MGALLTVEVAVSVLVAVAVGCIIWIAVRRWLITRDHLMILMARRRGDLWVMGMARTTAESVEWFPVLGLGLRPRWVLRRQEVEFGPPLPAGRVPAVIQDPVTVECTADGLEQRVAVSRGDYTQLRSWSESSPPGLNTGRY